MCSIICSCSVKVKLNERTRTCLCLCSFGSFTGLLSNFGPLSVSKWIHLNWGDEGLITLLSKVWRLLKPDGVSILEPQPWKSYISCRQVSEVASTNYKNLTIFPQQFQEILLDKVHFFPSRFLN
ncbi:putative RNA methyltransferase bin3, bin3-type S-adenosyl-L-methionine binding protein [Helianthus annuus]|nr:putative RNA methyltransferase bin3, bin3-type S-adenosyl-L-methionine binding protein [Helianthus annuus]